MFAPVSESEKIFIEDSCCLGVREDGRANNNLRHLYIENNVLPHSYGSSRVKVSDAIDVLCSVKADIRDTASSKYFGGVLEVTTSISPVCNITIDDRKLTAKANQISQILEKIYQSSDCLDLDKLCIVSGKSSWIIFVDLLIIQCDGDPVDACSLAVYTALSCTRLPKVEKIIGQSGKDEDYQISGDISDSIPLPILSMPIIITISKIGDSLVLDCTGKEISCISSLAVIAVDSQGRIHGISKVGGGSLSAHVVKTCLALAISAGRERLEAVQKFFSSSNPRLQQDLLYPEIPASRLGFLA